MIEYDYIGKGIYSIQEAAKYLDLSYERLRYWLYGKPSKNKKGNIITPEYEPIDSKYSISFYDLIDAYIMKLLLEKEQNIREIRKVYDILSNEMKTKHPFCHVKLKIHGPNIIAEAAQKGGAVELYNVIKRQMYFSEFRDGLEKLDYDKVNNLVSQIRIYRGIRINPKIAFGKPVINHTATTAHVIAKNYIANNKDAQIVARLFKIRPIDVIFAYNFEKKYGYLSKAA